MPRKCSICTHKKRDAIEKDILNNVSYRDIGTAYNVNYESVRRHHKNGHIAQELVKSSQAKDISDSDELMGDLLEWKKIIDESVEELKGPSRLQAVDRGMKWTELKAKIKKIISDSPQVNVGVQVNIGDLSGQTINFIKKHRLYRKFVEYMQGVYDAERTR